jgi:transposase
MTDLSEIGIKQTDAYAAYRSLADPKRVGGPVTLAYCWSHCRREFFDLAKTAPAPIATEALKRIPQFYQIEAEIRAAAPISARLFDSRKPGRSSKR